jgi:mannose-1-phosphate guanylyltransferase/mannose-6-phosphate isomerase
MSSRKVHAVILAGGSGSRLWPLSRQHRPKQFLALDGDGSLLQDTIERLAPVVESGNVLVVTQEAHAKGEAYHALQPYQLLFEPIARSTAPAIALAAAHLSMDGTDPVMVVLPADHVIRDQERFRTHLRSAIEAAGDGWLVTFGIRPTSPDSGFGYIKASGDSPRGICAVERFVEKPDAETAAQLLNEGGYYWNSGMFVWRASAILKELRRHLPDAHEIVEDIAAEARITGDFQRAVANHFARMPAISIDHAVLEKSANVALIPCDIGWSDVGSWHAVHEIADKDVDGNALRGNVIALDCKGSLIHSGKRLIAAIGVEDLCIVETDDAILISKKDQTQKVRDIVERLKERGATEHVHHTRVHRPWGSYTVLGEETSNFKIKRIEVAPGARLSLQSHRRRSEHWVVVSGRATVTNGDEITTVHKNQSSYIPVGAKHRLENHGDEPLHIVEVQVGEYLGEDDIQRYEDNYGR